MQANTFARAQRNYDRALPPTRGVTQEQIDRRASELMQRGGECYPLDSGNFLEAFDEVSVSDRQRVAAFAADGEFVLACQCMTMIVNDYWIARARELAVLQLEDEYFSGSEE